MELGCCSWKEALFDDGGPGACRGPAVTRWVLRVCRWHRGVVESSLGRSRNGAAGGIIHGPDGAIGVVDVGRRHHRQ